MAAPALPLAVFGLLLPIALYRRVRNNIGRQKLSSRRLTIRSVVVLSVLALIAAPAVQDGRLDALLALAVGCALGTAIGVLALRHTRFEVLDGIEYYVPHLYLGLALTALLLGRMGWRLWQVWPTLSQPGAAPTAPFSTMSPLTLALFGLILAYNASFSIGLLRHLRARAPRTG